MQFAREYGFAVKEGVDNVEMLLKQGNLCGGGGGVGGM